MKRILQLNEKNKLQLEFNKLKEKADKYNEIEGENLELKRSLRTTKIDFK